MVFLSYGLNKVLQNFICFSKWCVGNSDPYCFVKKKPDMYIRLIILFHLWINYFCLYNYDRIS